MIGALFSSGGEWIDEALRAALPGPPRSPGVALQACLFRACPAAPPFQDASGTLQLVADAELHNRRDLAAELAAAGAGAGTSALDADLILAAYRRWGDDCADHLIGEFAFILWDRPRERLLCARDAFGLRPLHWTRIGHTVGVASTVSDLLRLPGVNGAFDDTTLACHLTGARVGQDRTYYRGVQRVPNGHTLAVTRAVATLRPYWFPQPRAAPQLRRPAEARDAFQAALAQACTDRLPPPGARAGILLSGGLDSSSVAVLTQQQLRARGGDNALTGCTYVFDSLPSCNEWPYGEQVAVSLQIPLGAIHPERLSFLDDGENVDVEMPANFWQPALNAAFRWLREQGVRTVFTGHGGDDLLCPPPAAFLRRVFRDPVGVSRDLRVIAAHHGVSPTHAAYDHLLAPLLPRAWRRAARRCWRSPPATAPLPPWLCPAHVRQTGIADHLRQASSTVSLETLLAGSGSRVPAQPGHAWRILHWHTTLAARHGLHMAHPFYDRRLWDLRPRLPPEQCFSDGHTKHVLREAMRGLLPESVRLRPDKTYVHDFFHLCLKRTAAASITRLFTDSILAQRQIIDPECFRTHYQRYVAGQDDRLWTSLWRTIGLEYWMRRLAEIQPRTRYASPSTEPLSVTRDR